MIYIKRKKARFGFLYLLIGALTGAATSYFFKQTNIKNMPLLNKTLLNLFGLLLSSFIHIIIHETGHLVFGLISGYSFSSFRIFNFVIIKEDGRILFKNTPVAGIAGQCLMIPPDLKNDKISFILYNLGGSIFNLIFSFIFYIIYLSIDKTSYLSGIMINLTVIGIILALSNLIPLKLNLINNDGYNTLALLKNKKAIKYFWIQLKVNELLTNGARLRDLPSDWFCMPSDEDMKDSIIAPMGVWYANKVLDNQDFEEAYKVIDNLLFMDSAIIGLHYNMLICDKIFCELITHNRKYVIDELLDKTQISFMKQMHSNPSIIRTKYAMALFLYNDKNLEQESLKNFNKYSKSYPYNGVVIDETELIKVAKNAYVCNKKQ